MPIYFFRYKFQLIVFIAAIIILSIAAFQRNMAWTTEISLWQDARDKSSLKARPHANVGFVYYKQGNLDMAQEEYNRAIQLDPDYLAPYGPLAVIYGKKGDVDRAIKMLLWVIPRLPNKDKDPRFYTALGVAYKVKGLLKEAEIEFQKALMINPNYDTAHYNLAEIYKQTGLKQEAFEHYRRFVETAPPEMKELVEQVRARLK